MKLRGLEIEQFKKFDRPVRLDGIADGLNLVCGPNEMGKSTLLAAIRGALFERHRSTAAGVQEFQSGGNRTAPRVVLDFEIAGARYRIEKQFLQRPHARLTLPDGSRRDGDAAEEELQRILDFDGAKKGGVKDETLGTWGLLWVRQGQSFELPSLGEHERARSALHAALAGEVGAMTGGSRGKALPQAIQAKLRELLDGRGKPRGKYGEVLQRIEELDAELPALRGRIEALSQDLDGLARDTRELDRLDRDPAEAEERTRLVEARTRREAVLKLHADIREAEKDVELGRAAEARAGEAVEARAMLARQLDAATERATLAQDAAAQAAQAEEAATAACEIARRAVDGIEERQAASSAELRRLRRIDETSEAAARLEELRAQLARARGAHAAFLDLTRRAGEQPVTSELIDAIEAAARRHDKATATADAVATEIVFALRPEAASSVVVDGARLAEAGARLKVTTDIAIAVDGVGTIGVRPGVKNGRKLEVERREAEAALAELLARAGVETLEAARRRAKDRGQLLADAAFARRQEEREAPKGVAAVEAEVAELSGRLARALGELGIEAAPAREEARAACAAADRQAEAVEHEREAARAALAGPETAARAARDRAQASRAEAAGAMRQRDALARDLATARAAQPDDGLIDVARAARQAAEAAAARLAGLRQKDSEDLTLVDARIARYERLIEQRKERRSLLRAAVERTRARIEMSEGEGLQEKIRRKEGLRAQLEGVGQAYGREARVLQLLATVLSDAEREARERYTAPVAQRIRPYLQQLFPRAEIRLDENLAMTGLVRDGAEEEFSRLSDGTKEQIAVLARLALAELLAEQGRPASVILDDALVFSDDERMDRMFDILSAAARKTQIIVLSCRERLFGGLGAHRLALEPADRMAEAAE
jgi:DNA repair exonuclease SbcCD ATPase subunit